MKFSSRALFAFGFTAPLILVVFAVVLTASYHVAACPLCIVQRMLYLAIAFAALLGFLGAGSRPALMVAALLMAAASATGAAVASYQIYLVRNPFSATCGDGTAWWERLVEQAGQALPILFKAGGFCSDNTWALLGLSIVEWSLLAFLGLFLLALLALILTFRRQKLSNRLT